MHPLKEDIEWTHGKEHIKLYAHGGTDGKNPFWLCDVCGCVLGTDATAIMEALGMAEIRCTVNVSAFSNLIPRLLCSSILKDHDCVLIMGEGENAKGL